MGSGMLNLVARNLRTTVQTIRIPNSEPVTVTVSYTGHPTETYQPFVTNPGTETIVNIVRMDVQIASL